MHGAPLGAAKIGAPSLSHSFFPLEGLVKPECTRCPDICIFEHMATLFRTRSCRELRAELTAAAVEDTHRSMHRLIEELLDQGRTHEQVVADLGLSEDEFYAYYFYSPSPV